MDGGVRQPMATVYWASPSARPAILGWHMRTRCSEAFPAPVSAFHRASTGQVIRTAATSFVNPVEYQIVNMPQPSRILHPIVLVSLLTSGLTTVLSNTSALADGPSDVQILRTDIGFKGRFKVGCWTPIHGLVERYSKKTSEA